MSKFKVSIVACLLSLILGISITYKMCLNALSRTEHALLNTVEEFKLVSEKAAALEIMYKTQEELAQAAAVEWAKEKSALLSKIVANSSTTATSINQPVEHFPSTSGEEYTEIQITDGPSLGWVLRRADGSRVSKVFDFKIIAKTLTSTEEKTGRVSVVSKIFLKVNEAGSGNSLNWVGKEYQLTVTEGLAEVLPGLPSGGGSEGRRWTLGKTLHLGVFVGKSVGVGIGYPLVFVENMLKQTNFKFLEFGIVAFKDESVKVFVAPFGFGLGKIGLKNSLISPYYAFDSAGILFSVLL